MPDRTDPAVTARPRTWLEYCRRGGDLTRVARADAPGSAGAVAFSAVIPVMEVVMIGHRIGLASQLWAAAITACYLPGYLALVHHAARGTRMRYRYGPVAAVAVIAVAVAVSPALTGTWCAVVALGVAALLVLRIPWSLLLAATGIAAQTSWVLAYGPGLGSAIWRGFSLVWSVAAVYAVAQERVRTEQQRRYA